MTIQTKGNVHGMNLFHEIKYVTITVGLVLHSKYSFLWQQHFNNLGTGLFT